MRKKSKLVYGVGINDADYAVKPRVNGRVVWCKFYRSWIDRLKSCYCKKFQAKHPTYVGCTVCDEWLTYSNFKKWMETQDWKGKQLDKDILFVGNKIYSPNTCVFVDGMTNSFITDRRGARGDYPVGVRLHNCGKHEAQCSNPFTKKNESLGLFTYSEQAHQAWRKRKHELACQLAELQTDERVAKALRERYAPDKDLTNW